MTDPALCDPRSLVALFATLGEALRADADALEELRNEIAPLARLAEVREQMIEQRDRTIEQLGEELRKAQQRAAELEGLVESLRVEVAKLRGPA